ncbi:hypothetical protein KJ591_00250, partial [Patescibacteria group bacterium]|nr:hypothetical protein [Patescibacteria group bacterium]
MDNNKIINKIKKMFSTKMFSKKKVFGRALLVSLTVTLMIGGVFVYVTPAQAIISGGTIAGVAATDLVAGATNVDYSVAFDTDITAIANQIVVTFPAGYTITDGDLTTSAVSDGTTLGRIKVNGVTWSVNNVTGSAAGKTITIVFADKDLSVGTGVTFRILLGVQNPTATGATGAFTFDSDAAAETAQSNVAAVTITSAAVSYLKVTAASATPTAGATDELTVTAYDQYNNVCSSGTNIYDGAKSLTFSGLSNAPLGTVPTVEAVNLGSATSITFTAGASGAGLATLIAYKAEGASLDVTDGTYNSTGDGSYDVDLVVAPGTATQLAFSQEPGATTVSGIALGTQPIVQAWDAYNNIDTSFIELITLTEGSAGGLTNNTKTAIAGVAEFSTLTYSNAADGESFTLTADDEVGAPDLTPKVSGVSVASDVLATKLVISGVSGAVDSAVEFAENITLTVQAQNAQG